MKNVEIDYEAITQAVRERILSCASSLGSNAKIVVEQERQFAERKRLDERNAIFAVVDFDASEMRFNAVAIGATIRVITEEGSFDEAREIMSAFAKENSLSYCDLGTSTLFQKYDTPETQEAFVDVGAGYRSYLTLDCVFIVSDDGLSLPISLQYNGHSVSYVSLDLDFSSDIRPLPFPNGNGYAESEIGFSTFGFTVTMLAGKGDGNLYESALSAAIFGDADARFPFSLQFGERKKEMVFALQNLKANSKLGEPTTYVASFALATDKGEN